MAKCYSCGRKRINLLMYMEETYAPKCKLYVELATNEVKRLDMMDKIAAVGLRILGYRKDGKCVVYTRS